MQNGKRKGRLRRSDCSGPGLTRVRRGRGFSYIDEKGGRIADPAVLERIQELAIPPAWRDVWICPDPLGHLQATGSDEAGRKQYLYHEQWRVRRDRQKFLKMVEFAHALPRLRRQLAADLQGEDAGRERVLACAVRLLDIGLFRIGSEEYAENGGGFGLATLHKSHVKLRDGLIVFDYPAKGGNRRVHAVEDPLCLPIVIELKKRRGGGQELLAYRNGRRWVGLRSDEINDYLKRHAGPDFSAKDFRTWNATVLASVVLAGSPPRDLTKTGRRRAIKDSIRAVADLLGNTPAVARRAYIDPRVFDRYLAGATIEDHLPRLRDLDISDERSRVRIERALLRLLER